MTLFKSGDFILPTGERTDWVINCDSLTDEDMQTLARIAADLLPPFGAVIPVMRNGPRFAQALTRYTQEGGRLLIAEDVVTTGNSMEEIRDGRDCLGIAIFARRPPPVWITALWTMPANQI